MQCLSKSIRAFIGAKNFDVSRRFYRALGFEEVVLDPQMSYFKVRDSLGFYLQDYYTEEWVDNSMLSLQVRNFDACCQELLNKSLSEVFPGVWLSGIKTYEWGRELDMLDPSGVLWHFAEYRAN
ncbi:MAG: hypothetical protein WA952_12910 [Lewinella sp.]